MHLNLLENGVIQCNNENYQPWPNFRPLGAERIGGLWRSHFLHEILCLDDLICAAWREPIPPEILQFLQRFPECHAELLEMAQADPVYFLKLAAWNPAATLIAATYWCFRNIKRVPNIEERLIIWENLDIDDLLHFTRSLHSKSYIRALSNISIGHAYAYRINRLSNLWAIRERRNLLRHLTVITGENLWLLSCFPPILDPAIHSLAASEPYYEEYSIQQIVSDLANRRELVGLQHWPYRNRIHSWPQLLKAYNKFLAKTNCMAESLPMPPIDGVDNEDIEIVPLKSRTALQNEADEIHNCIESYVVKISSLENYAYKLLRPERATVLLKRRYDRTWEIEEAMTSRNLSEVRPETMELIRQWIRSREN